MTEGERNFERGRRVLITGAARGIGLELARRFARNHDRIFITDILPEIEQVAHLLEQKTGQPIRAACLDLSQQDACQHLVELAQTAFGSIDILINNAVIRKMALIEALDDQAWQQALQVNLSAAFALIRGFLPAMRQQNWGRIINMASVYSLIALEGRADYVTTKHALIGLTRTVALEVAATSISCNAICPGLMATDSALERIAALAQEKGIDETAATTLFLSTRQPGGKFIPMETVTQLALFLSSPHSCGINGAAIPVDNGWSFS